MTTNPVNLTPEDQLLSWCQEIEARQEEQTRQMAELREQANRLREENERLRTQLEAGRAGQSREPPHPFPPSRPDKGKEVAAPDDVELQADDELSSGSSPLPRYSPSPMPQKPTREKGRLAGLAGPSALQGIRCGENPAGTNDLLHQLPNMCLIRQGASPQQCHPCTRLTGPPPRRK